MIFPESRARLGSPASTRESIAGWGVLPPRSGAKPLSWPLFLIVFALTAACSPGRGAEKRAGAARPSIVLVVLDTVRADRLTRPSPGTGTLATPTLDAFARTAIVYDNARSPAPMTMPAMASVMTGRYPHSVGITGHSRADRIRPGAETLAAAARSAGYRTAAVVTNPWLAHPASGFARDFETFVSGHTLGRTRTRVPAAEVAQEAVRALESQDPRPVLLWVHFLDAHMPYTDGEVRTPITEDFAEGTAARSRIFFEPPYSTADIAATRSAYDSAIARIDGALAGLFDRLPPDAIVVVLADHGESLGEHGLHFAHDFTLYDELLRVPLIVRAPGLAPGRDSTPVSLIDVLPTICALAGLDCETDLDGLRLPRTGGDDQSSRFATRALYAASSPLRARYRCPWLTVPGIEGRWTMTLVGQRKLIRIPTRNGSSYRAYDLTVDPGELVDRADLERDEELIRELETWSKEAAVEPTATTTYFPKQLTRELRELGYLE